MKIKSGRAAVDLVQPLTRGQIALLVETAFWASLRSNEGRTIYVCVSVTAPENFRDAVTFAAPVTYDELQIVKLAPAVPPDGCLVVSGEGDGLSIWGFGRSRPGSWIDTVTIEVTEPGIVRVNVGPFQPFAVLNGRENLIIAGTRTHLAHYLRDVLQKALPVGNMLETQAV